jgi:hypothetical protein
MLVDFELVKFFGQLQQLKKVIKAKQVQKEKEPKTKQKILLKYKLINLISTGCRRRRRKFFLNNIRNCASAI